MFQPHRWPASDTLDDCFIAHYAHLVARAQQLLGRDRQAAEDLVHDVYLRLALRRFDVATVQNVEAYLVTTLRNVHLSQVRRGRSTASSTTSIIDYDSLIASLRSLASDEDRRDAHEALRHVARYACQRKRSSKGASVLILRFFHGYYPAEIARIVRTSEAAVAGRLRLARAEARAHLADPTPVRTFGRRHRDVPPDDGTAFVLALRQAIFDSRTGDCLSSRALDHVYAGHHTDPLDTGMLAHLVSCPLCLDAVNHRLGLPLLADRHPGDTLGRGPTNTGGGSSGAADLTSILRTKLDDARGEEPNELQIVVNGLFIGSQAINSPLSEQRLKVLVTEPVGFVEIFDEHGTCLLYLDVVAPPAGLAAQSAHVALHHGRRLSAAIAFADAAPTVDVVYLDPAAPSEARAVVAVIDAPAAATSALSWLVWPPLRLVIAGVVLGVLLAHPRQTLAAVDRARHLVVDAIVQLVETLRPRRRLPSQPVVPTAEPIPFARAIARVTPAAQPEASVVADINDVDLSTLLIEILQRLDDADALTQEQVAVERCGRQICVEGVVADETRRAEIEAALGGLATLAVRVNLAALDMAARHPVGAAPLPATFRSADLLRNVEPVAYESLRRALGDASPAEVRQYAAATLAHALNARLQARTLRQIVEAIPPRQTALLSSSALQTLQTLAQRHTASFRAETMALRHDLEQVFDSVATDDVPPARHDGAARQIAGQLFDRATAHDAAVRLAFAVVDEGVASLDVGTAAFRHSLLEAEHLAETLLAALSDTTSRQQRD